MSDISRIAANAVKESGLHTIKIKNRDQEEITYTITLLPATQSAAIAVELGKLFGPAGGAVADSVRNKDIILPEDDKIYTEFAMLLCSRLDNISVIDLLFALTKGTTCNGQQVDIDKEFRGNLAGLIKLVTFSLKENIGPLDGLLGEASSLIRSTLQAIVPQQEDTSN